MTIEPPHISDKALMTVIQAAKILGVSPQTVRRALKLGRKYGGMDGVQRCSRLKVSGAEVKRYWFEH